MVLYLSFFEKIILVALGSAAFLRPMFIPAHEYIVIKCDRRSFFLT